MLFVILSVATVKMLTKHFFRELVILNGCEGSLYSHCLRSLVATLCRDDNPVFWRTCHSERSEESYNRFGVEILDFSPFGRRPLVRYAQYDKKMQVNIYIIAINKQNI